MSTSVIDRPLTRYRLTPTRGGAPEVDRTGGDYKAGLIRGVSIITRGEALGHYQWIDQAAVESVARLGKRAKRGVKARFTHPGLSGDGLGTFLGRFKNFRIDDDRALADLHLQKSAHNTPDGNLAAYVMDLAEEDPEAFGTSIVFDHDFGEEDRFVVEHEDEDDTFHSPDDDNTADYRHIRLARLWAADVVDEPAANPGGLFREGHEIAEEADQLCQFALGLSNQRPVLRHLSADADRIAQFASRFLNNHNLEVRTREMAEQHNTPDSDPSSVTAEQLAAFGDALLTKVGAVVDEKIAAALAAQSAEAQPNPAAEERKRCGDLFSIAKSAGLNDADQIALDAIGSGLSVEQFKASLAERLIAQNGLTKDSGQHDDDPDEVYKAEYRKGAASFALMGVTEEEYVVSRKVDDGRELLAAAQTI